MLFTCSCCVDDLIIEVVSSCSREHGIRGGAFNWVVNIDEKLTREEPFIFLERFFLLDVERHFGLDLLSFELLP